MPNWCENKLTVTGPSEALSQLVDLCKGPSSVEGEGAVFLCFPNIIPQPHFTGEDEWYGWNCTNWGTKWALSHEDFVQNDLSDEEWQLSFLSAWTPPEPIIKELGRRFPQLFFKFEYGDPAMDFQGIIEIKYGQVIMEDVSKYTCGPISGERECEEEEEE